MCRCSEGMLAMLFWLVGRGMQGRVARNHNFAQVSAVLVCLQGYNRRFSQCDVEHETQAMLPGLGMALFLLSSELAGHSSWLSLYCYTDTQIRVK